MGARRGHGLAGAALSPGSPGVGVDVEGLDGSGELRRRLEKPHLHVGAGVPLRLAVLRAVIAQSSQDAHALLLHMRRTPLPPQLGVTAGNKRTSAAGFTRPQRVRITMQVRFYCSATSSRLDTTC